MKRGKQIDPWYPFFTDKWLFGSTRHELIISAKWAEKYPELVPLVPESFFQSQFTDLRGIYLDLLTLSKKDGGYIRANETTPYPLEQLAGMWCVPLEQLKATIAICLSETVGKLSEPSPGIYYITSTDDYALSRTTTRNAQAEGPHPPMPIGLYLPRVVRCPEEYGSMKMASGFVRISRLIVAMAIKRSLTEAEEVHHINARDFDDKIDNLMLFATHQDHLRYQHGHMVHSLWDGRQVDENTRDRISAEFSALGVDKSALYYLFSSNIDSSEGGVGGEEEKPKKTIPETDVDPIDYELTDLLISLMRSNNPKSAILKRMTPETRMKWADVSRKLRDIDGHTCEEIRYLIRFSQADQFWHTNVLSMAALRKYWDRLEMQARSRNWRPTDNVGRNKGKAPDPAVEQRINELATSFWVGCQAEEAAARNRGPAEYEKFKTAKTAELEKLIIKARYGSEN